MKKRDDNKRHLSRASFNAGVLILVLILGNSCSKKVPEKIDETIFALGTTCTVQLYGRAKRDVMEKVFELVRDVESKMSVRIDGTEAWRINENAGSRTVKVSRETFTVVKRARDYSVFSGGSFDLTIEPLVNLWSIGSEDQRVPSEEEIADALKMVDYRRVRLDEENLTVFLERPGMGIDLGGIAKGYAADISVAFLEEQGISHGIINFGGNVFAFGAKHGRENWKIGIQSPGSGRGEYVGIVEVKNKAVVTSGEYERYFVEDGVRYHHILSTEDGYPVRNELSSVSVVSDRALDADALSTVLYTMGLKRGLARAEELDGVEAIFLTDENTVYTTDGLKSSFYLTHDEYRRGEPASLSEGG